MIIYFADRRMNILGQAATGNTNGLYVIDDIKTEEVDAGVVIFEFTLPFTKDGRKKAETMTNAGNYILRHNGIEAEFYTIIDSDMDVDKSEISIYAEDAGMDLLNEICGSYEADQAYGVAYYIEKFTYDSGFEIGVNEISDLTRTLKWTGEATATSRLLSVATEFDNANISFSFEIKNLTVTHKYINIHKKRGKSSGTKLTLNRELDNLIIKKSVANLATALEVTGGTPERDETGEAEEDEGPITLSGYTYDDGDFYVSGSMLKSRKALSKWSRYLSETGTDVGHIVKTFTYDTTSQSELCKRALTELKKICDMEVNYEIDISELPKGVAVGDTVDVVDETGKLYLSARILKLETSIVNETAKATLGDYLIKDSGISQKVEELANQFSNLAKNRNFYTWVAYADDKIGSGISLDPTNKKYLGTAVNRVVKTPDISDPTLYTWILIKGKDGSKHVGRAVIRNITPENNMMQLLSYTEVNTILGTSYTKTEISTKVYIQAMNGDVYANNAKVIATCYNTNSGYFNVYFDKTTSGNIRITYTVDDFTT